MRYYIKATDAAHRTKILTVLRAAGINIHGKKNLTVEQFNKDFPWTNYPNVFVEDDEAAGTAFFPNQWATLGEVVDLYITSKHVRLNEKYTAQILPDGSVSVGCQTFTAEVAKELANAILNK